MKTFHRFRLVASSKPHAGTIVRILVLLLVVTSGTRACHAASHYQILKSFGNPSLAGQYPNPLIQGSDGELYGTTASGTVFRTRQDGSGYTVLHRFGFTAGDGQALPAPLLEASDGVLYGTTYGSGPTLGAVFKLNKDGSGYSILHNFGSDFRSGYAPLAGLIEGSDSALYGTTSDGGASTNGGTVFKLNKDGSGYRVLYNFGNSGADGQSPQAGLLLGREGALYGTTYAGGAYTNQYGQSLGTVFKLNRDGSGYSVLHRFGSNPDGQNPQAGLIEGSDGALYGTTTAGGSYTNQYGESLGTAFRINKDGSGYTTLHIFGGIAGDGSIPAAALTEGGDGALYGTTSAGGGSDQGTVFKLNKGGGGYKLLLSFGANGVDGQAPNGLLLGNDGLFYGTTSGGDYYSAAYAQKFGAVFRVNQDGSGYHVLHNFSEPSGGEGRVPQALIEASDGALYGIASEPTLQETRVFTLNRDGSGYRVLNGLTAKADKFDPYPPASLVQGSDGALYGTSAYGGAYTNQYGEGYGTVFKLNRDGSGYSVLHNFDGTGDDYFPVGLIEATDGVLYGSTAQGAVFKLSRDGSGYAVLGSTGVSYGSAWSPIVVGTNGLLYGATSGGGAFEDAYHDGMGTVFKLNRDGGGFTVLYNFGSTDGDGQNPQGPLVAATDGAFYGTTSGGGRYGDGTVFKLNADGSGYVVLLSFSNSFNGVYSVMGLAQLGLLEGIDGPLYGTSSLGGAYTNQDGEALGTVFRLNKNGSSYSVLHNFTNDGADGQHPQAGLVQGSDGALYGITAFGGDLGFGTVFKIWPPETPEMTGVSLVNSAVQVGFSGMPGYRYRLLRSTDLINWIVLTTITMPSSGVFTNLDNTPPAPAAYYRAAWLP